jgi:hypothetical protein
VKNRVFASFWTWFCLTAVLLVVYYAPVLFFQRDFFQSDHCFYFEPFARLIGEGFRAGHLPLWNPYCYSGMPQVANPSPGIFYWPDLLFAVLPYSQAMGWILVIQQLVAFTGAFLLIESLGWGLAAAALAGLIMALNGYMMSLSANYSLPGSAAWGILALYAILNINRPEYDKPGRFGPRAGFICLTAFAVQGMLLAGRPEVYVPFMALIGTLAGFIWLGLLSPFSSLDISQGESKANFGRRTISFAWSIAAIILGIAISAFVLFPVFEWSKLSPRAGGIKLEHVFYWSSNWYDLLCMLCPQPLGDLQQPSPWLKLVGSRTTHYPFLPSALVGPVVISLAMLGLGDKTFKERFYMLGGLAAALIMAVGKYGAVSAYILKAVPFLTVLRYPCKLLVVVILFLAVLAARGLYALAEDRLQGWQKKSLCALWLVSTIVASVLAFGAKYCVGHLTTLPEELLHKLGYSLMITSLIGLFVSAAVYCAGDKSENLEGRKIKLRFAAPSVALLLVFLMVASVFAPSMKNQFRTVAGGFFSRPSFLQETILKLDRNFNDSITGRYLPLYFDPLKVADGYSPRYPAQIGEPFMQYARELSLQNTNIDSHLREAFGYESSENQDYRLGYLNTLHISSVDKKPSKDVVDVELARFCTICAVKYVGTQIESVKGSCNMLSARYFKLVHEDVPMNFRIYEVLNTFPRAYFAPAYRTIASQKEVIKAVMAPEANINNSWSEFERNALIELDSKNDVSTDPFAANVNQDRRAEMVLAGKGEPAKPEFKNERVVSMVEAGDLARQPNSFLKDDPEHVSISVKAPADGFFILNDRFYPGWHAVVDTLPQPLYRANGFMRAVYLTKGAHLVEFKYEPESLRNGLLVAGGAFLLLTILALFFLKRPVAHTVQYLSTGKWPEEKEPAGEASLQEV